MPRLEYRVAGRDVRSDGRTLFGIAAPYGQAARIGTFDEKIARGAFARTLREGSDVMLLRDHDQTQLLARTRNRSLVLEDQPGGLGFRAELAEFTLADDTLAMARAGLLAGCSIGFFVRGESWSANRDQRTLADVELVEISAVAAAVAYPNTAIAARAARPACGRDRLLRRLAGL